MRTASSRSPRHRRRIASSSARNGTRAGRPSWLALRLLASNAAHDVANYPMSAGRLEAGTLILHRDRREPPADSRHLGPAARSVPYWANQGRRWSVLDRAIRNSSPRFDHRGSSIRSAASSERRIAGREAAGGHDRDARRRKSARASSSRFPSLRNEAMAQLERSGGIAEARTMFAGSWATAQSPALTSRSWSNAPRKAWLEGDFSGTDCGPALGRRPRGEGFAGRDRPHDVAQVPFRAARLRSTGTVFDDPALAAIIR